MRKTSVGLLWPISLGSFVIPHFLDQSNLPPPCFRRLGTESHDPNVSRGYIAYYYFTLIFETQGSRFGLRHIVPWRRPFPIDLLLMASLPPDPKASHKSRSPGLHLPIIDAHQKMQMTSIKQSTSKTVTSLNKSISTSLSSMSDASRSAGITPNNP